MTFDEVSTRIDQPMDQDIHRGIRVDFSQLETRQNQSYNNLSFF